MSHTAEHFAQPRAEELSDSIAKETWLLAFICIVDMVSTVWLLGANTATEANPIMRFYVELGLPTFIAVKSLLIFAPLYLLELIRRKRPRFIVGLLRAAIAGYLIVYGLGVVQVNNASAASPANSAFTSPEFDLDGR